MKKVKYILLILVLVILGTIFYENYIFYRIAYNPFAKLDPDSLTGFHFTENHPDNDITKSIRDVNKLDLIFEYFSDLDLMPIKWDDIPLSKENTYYSGMFTFGEAHKKHVFVNEIFLDNLSYLHISSDIEKFKDGYYIIVDDEFDYEYIDGLIEDITIDNSKDDNKDSEIENVLSQRFYQVREKFEWLEKENFSKVILKDYAGNTIDITNDELFKELMNTANNSVYPRGINEPSFITLGLPYYELTFFNDLDAENQVIIIYDNFIEYDYKIYDSNFFCSLAKAYMPIIPELKSDENNLLNVVYESEFSVSMKLSYQSTEEIRIAEHKKFRLSSIYIAQNMEEVPSINNDDDKLVLTEIYAGYKDNEKIYLYIYDYDIYDAKFVKLVYKDKEEYYEQKENLCIEGEPSDSNCLYKLWGAN